MYAVSTVNGKNKNVRKPSQISTFPGEKYAKIKYNQTYANTDHVAVTKKTLKCFIFLDWPFGITDTQIAIITNKLYAADPTIVPIGNRVKKKSFKRHQGNYG